MRRHGPCTFPGNSIAARRLARKPPRIILWSIGIITCLLFAGAAAMLAVGYLNPFGTVGLSILGVGAVAYFGGIIFLVLSCLWVERKYPGMQPLSFRIYSRKPPRPPPTVFMNPNVSGQVPQDTTQDYRTHDMPSTLTGISDIERGMDNIAFDPEENIHDKKNKNKQSKLGHSGDLYNLPTITESIQDEESNIDDRSKVITKEQTITKDTNTTSRSIGNISTEGNSQVQQEHLKFVNNNTTGTTVHTEKDDHYNKQENNTGPSSNPQTARKLQQKTHHTEVPQDDYTYPANATPSYNTKYSIVSSNSSLSQKNNSIESSNPQMRRKVQHTFQQMELPLEDYPSPAISTSTHNTEDPQPQAVSTHCRNSSECKHSDITWDLAAVTYQEEKTPQKRKANKKNVSFQMSSTDEKSAEQISPLTNQNATLHSNTEIERSFEKDKKGQDPSQTAKLQTSSAIQERNQIQAHKISRDSVSLVKDSQGNLPTLTGKLSERPNNMQTIENLRKMEEIQLKNDQQLLHSSNIRKSVSLALPQRSPDSYPNVPETKGHSVSMASKSSNKDGLYKSPSTPPSNISFNLSSLTRQQTRSPEVSSNVLKHHIHSSRNTGSYSNERKEELHSSHCQQLSPSSYSSDSASSPSPQRHRDHQNSDISNTEQKCKDMGTVNTGITSHTQWDGLHKKFSQQSSQVSPTKSPVRAIKSHMNTSFKSQHTSDQSTETSSDGDIRHQVKHSHSTS